jgi:hypothetical protein
MVIACRWETIWNARHNHKIYGETEPYFLLDQSRARIFSVVYGYDYGYGTPVETLLVLALCELETSTCFKGYTPFSTRGSGLPKYL